ncbi:MAG: FemAB family XrtA/PEP-CTERM system-associated protein [Pseudomonadota bacterium]
MSIECHRAPPTAAPAPAAGAALKVGLLQPADRARWDAFVMACPQATFFHRAGWQEVIENAFGHRTWFLYAESDGRIVGVLPLAQVKSRLFGHSLCSLPFCVYGGPASEAPPAAAALDRAAQELAARLGVGHLEYRSREAGQPGQAGGPDDGARWQRRALYCTFRKTLAATEEANLLAIPRKQRAMVRKGIAAGLHSTLDEGIAPFFDVYGHSVHRLGTPMFAPAYFHVLRRVFGDDCAILTVRQGERPVSSVLLFYFRDEVLPYYGGGLDLARAVAGNDFLYWEVMRRAVQRGCTLFDFGRSKLGTGAYDFKNNWGFDAQPLHYAYQLHRAQTLPEVNPLNPRYRLAIAAWRRLPLPVANRLGPHLVRYLG